MRTLWTHTKTALRRPGAFVFSRPFAILWNLYAATFTAANTVDTLVSDWRPAAVSTATFLATVAVNVPLGIRKDLRFAECFGGPVTTKTVSASAIPVQAVQATEAAVKAPTVRAGVASRATAAVFLFRDSLTLFGSFGRQSRHIPFQPVQLGPLSILFKFLQGVLLIADARYSSTSSGVPRHTRGHRGQRSRNSNCGTAPGTSLNTASGDARAPPRIRFVQQAAKGFRLGEPNSKHARPFRICDDAALPARPSSVWVWCHGE